MFEGDGLEVWGKNTWKDCGFGGNVFVWNVLVDIYAKCCQIDQGRWLFDRMVKKDAVS